MPSLLFKLLIPGVIALGAGIATAQPVPVPIPLPPPPPPGDPKPPPADPPITDPVLIDTSKPVPPVDEPPPIEVVPTDQPTDGEPEEEPVMLPRTLLPELLLAPAGTMLQGGVIYSRTGPDTSGGFSSDLRVGLGDVAEFGVATTDLMRARAAYGAPPERLAPYFTATFRMGLDEDRLFLHQPALALGFRKSFEFEEGGHRSRIAELHLAATKHLGKRAAIHANASIWDASVDNAGEAPTLLHDQGLMKQLRGGGGIEVRAVRDSDILVDVAWVPELCYTCSTSQRIKLRPILSWGVRYDLAAWMQFQAGVRVPDIGDANLLDAQIFGQLTILNSTLRRAVKAAHY